MFKASILGQLNDLHSWLADDVGYLMLKTWNSLAVAIYCVVLGIGLYYRDTRHMVEVMVKKLLFQLHRMSGRVSAPSR